MISSTLDNVREHPLNLSFATTFQAPSTTLLKYTFSVFYLWQQYSWTSHRKKITTALLRFCFQMPESQLYTHSSGSPFAKTQKEQKSLERLPSVFPLLLIRNGVQLRTRTRMHELCVNALVRRNWKEHKQSQVQECGDNIFLRCGRQDVVNAFVLNVDMGMFWGGSLDHDLKAPQSACNRGCAPFQEICFCSKGVLKTAIWLTSLGKWLWVIAGKEASN